LEHVAGNENAVIQPPLAAPELPRKFGYTPRCFVGPYPSAIQCICPAPSIHAHHVMAQPVVSTFNHR